MPGILKDWQVDRYGWSRVREGGEVAEIWLVGSKINDQMSYMVLVGCKYFRLWLFPLNPMGISGVLNREWHGLF